MRLLTVMTLLMMSAVLVLPGCGPSEADASAAAVPRDLSFTVVNDSDGKMTGIGLEGANYPISFGPIDAGDASTIRSKKLELPETLTLHWNDYRGNRHEGTARIWNNLGPAYSGPVTLTVNERNKLVLSGG